MSNEEQAVLDFFNKEENLPLGLSVAELVDGIRQRMNNDFWLALQGQLTALLAQHALPWKVETTEDRNASECIVGLYLQPAAEQTLFLRPMLEQQAMGETTRIYYGLAWSTAPTPENTRLASVTKLRETLHDEGFKNNEHFLAWGWTPHRPRRKDFLLRLSTEKDALLGEVTDLIRHLLVDHGAALDAANTVLREVPRSATVSLDKLRVNLKHQENT